MPIILYDLCGADGRRFSPNCWRTRMALEHKGIPYEARATRFTEIQTEPDGRRRTLPTIEDGGRVVRRGENLGILRGGQFDTIPAERPLVFGGVMYIPPFGTVNRKIPDVLGAYKLDTGDGILIHGTNDPLAVGFWGTHGCVRLFDDDIEFVFENTPVGTPVYVY